MKFIWESPIKMKELESLFVMKERMSNPLAADITVDQEDIDVFAYKIMDDFGGMQKGRGLDGHTTPIEKGGHTEVTYTPGYYGEFYQMTEAEKLRGYGSQDAINRKFEDMYAYAVQRETLRTMWSAVQACRGLIAVPDPNDPTKTLHKWDFGVTTTTSIIPVTTYATSTPLADLDNIKLNGNRNVDFENGRLYMNSRTLRHIIRNANPNDLGKYSNQLNPSMTADRLSNILVSDYKLPPVTIVDNRYINDAGTAVDWIPDGQALLKARIPGQPLFHYTKTRCLTADGTIGVGSWDNVFQSDRAPFLNGFERGHNGAMVMPYGAVDCYPIIFHP
jgi:hypothetical protein